jgi:Putative prokaryotic signal transducing protein
MKELLRSNELVFLSWIQALLTSESIEPILLDTHTSVLEGSTLAIPRRVMVHDQDYRRARQLVTDAGDGAHLSPE